MTSMHVQPGTSVVTHYASTAAGPPSEKAGLLLCTICLLLIAPRRLDASAVQGGSLAKQAQGRPPQTKSQ